MLNEFIEDVKKELSKLAEMELRKLVSTDGNERHDLVRGAYQGLTKAIQALEELKDQYTAEEDKPVVLADVREVANQKRNAERVGGRRFSRGG